ncbi:MULTISPECIES: glycosyltransferase family 2 protein [Xanthomonas]|uniref:glycosyltransferase family 2 protein n=1 Tax=Xanthomonas TaxID=338 RepID=UPI001FD55890|nr:glycosyltransferase family 2 protein [Xanthomonas phaseoli]
MDLTFILTDDEVLALTGAISSISYVMDLFRALLHDISSTNSLKFISMSASFASLPSCALIVLTYNWPQALRLVLESVKRQSRLPDEVIVVDDGSGAETSALMNALIPDFPVPLRHVWQEDRGFRAARCRNLGIAATSAQYVVLIDGDMLLHRDFVADHLALARPGRFLQGGRIKLNQRATIEVLAGRRPPSYTPWAPADFRAFDATPRLYAFRQLWLARWKSARPGGRVMSCNMSFWRQDLVRVNGFDEAMQGYGAEDRELAVRLANAGVAKHPLKWAALACHLEHRSRAQTDVDDASLPNNRRLMECQRSGAVWCLQGLDAHPSADA